MWGRSTDGADDTDVGRSTEGADDTDGGRSTDGTDDTDGGRSTDGTDGEIESGHWLLKNRTTKLTSFFLSKEENRPSRNPNRIGGHQSFCAFAQALKQENMNAYLETLPD